MDAFIYHAAMLCAPCAEAVMTDLGPRDEREDSDDYPQGPYSAGGGEADTPQHCDHCNTFLENPLTSEGRAYVQEAVTEWAEGWRRRASSGPVVAAWSAFYGITAPDYETAARAHGWSGEGQNWTHSERLGVIYESAYAACAADNIKPE